MCGRFSLHRKIWLEEAVGGARNVDSLYQGHCQYEEGIYISYRFYETADAEGYFDSEGLF